MEAQTEVIIIGGGLGGLSTACYLAREGVRVTLFEKASQLGGRAASTQHQGYWLNRGVHAFYSGGAAEQVLNELEITYSAGIPKNISILKQGKLHLAPISAGTLLRTDLLSLTDKLDLMRVFAAFPRLNAHDFAAISIQAWIEQSTTRPLVRDILATNARTFVYSAALDLVSAEVFIAKTQTTIKDPIFYIDGGWQTLVDGLRRKAEGAGVKIITDQRVMGIEQDEQRVTGVRLQDGQRMPADAVIIATSPKEAVKLEASLQPIVDALIPAQIACLDVMLSRLPNTRYPIVQDSEYPRFLTTQSLFSKVAPEGGAIVYTFKQLDPRISTDPREDERELEALLDVSQPGWRDVLVKRQYLPRIDAVGALPTAESGGFAGRPKTQAAGIENLYLVGDWVGDEGFLVDASMASAREVAQRLSTQFKDKQPRVEYVGV